MPGSTWCGQDTFGLKLNMGSVVGPPSSLSVVSYASIHTPQPRHSRCPPPRARGGLSPCAPPPPPHEAPEKDIKRTPMAMTPHASAATVAVTPALRFPHTLSATGLSSPPLAGGCGGCRVRFRPSQRGRGTQGRRGGSHVSRVGGLLGTVFGGGGRDDGEATRKKYADTVARINSMEPEVSALSDADLRARTAALQDRARSGESLDSLLPVRTQIYNGHSYPFTTVCRI